MHFSNGDLVAWDLTADLLVNLDPDEAELVGEIAWSAHGGSKRIVGIPGAFDIETAGIVTTAVTIFAGVAEALRQQLPKIFDATVDVARDMLKDRLKRTGDTTRRSDLTLHLDAARLHELVRVAALNRRLSTDSASAIADAVVARLLVEPPMR